MYYARQHNDIGNEFRADSLRKTINTDGNQATVIQVSVAGIEFPCSPTVLVSNDNIRALVAVTENYSVLVCFP